MAGRPIKRALVPSQYKIGLCPKMKYPPLYGGIFIIVLCYIQTLPLVVPLYDFGQSLNILHYFSESFVLYDFGQGLNIPNDFFVSAIRHSLNILHYFSESFVFLLQKNINYAKLKSGDYMLNCVYGANGSGKTEYMYDKIRDNMKNGIKSFILVPEQASMDTERNMLMNLGMSAQLKVEVLTFSRLSNLVFSHCGPLRLKYIDKAGKLFVAQKALWNLENSLKYYNRNVHQRGFAQMTASLISELKRYGVETASVFEASKKTKNEELSKKLADIALIYEEYDKLISNKYSDAEENLIKAIPGIGKSKLFSGEFFVTGFKSFTPVEHLALANIMSVAEVTAFLCTDTLEKTDGVFASATMTWDKLKSDGENAGIAIGEIVYLKEDKKFEGKAELAHLKNNYFKYPPNIYKEETQNLALVFARGGYDEVKQGAKIITSLCQKENYKYKDFLILARNTDGYKGAVKAVFSEYNIRCFINEKKSLSSNPFIRKVMAAVEILAYGFSYERIMPIVRFGGKGYDTDEGDIFENYVLGANITHKYWNSVDDWTYNPDERRISLETVNKVKRATVNSVIKLSEAIKGRKTAAEICRAVLDWVKEEELDKTMSQRVEGFNKHGETAIALEYTRAWNAFSSVISQMEGCCGDDYITYEKFYELLRSACDEITLNIAPPMTDQVTFAEIDTFRKQDAKVVILLGLSDGVFPKGYIEDGMLSDIERDCLKDMGVELAPTASYKRREEQNLIYNVITAANEKLFLSSPLGDKEGKAVVRSEIIDRICELFPKIKVIDEEETSQSALVIFKSLLGALAKAKGDKEKLSKQDRIIYDYFAEDKNVRDELLDFEDSMKKYSPDAKLTPSVATELYGKKLMLSVSKLEKYNACAFSYFMQYGLLAKERLRAGFEANNVGSILHETLQIYLEELKLQNADYGKITENECRDRVGEIAEKAAKDSDDLLYETSPYYRYVALRIKSVAAATAWEIVKFYANSKYRPYGFEVKIGGDGMFSGMRLDLGNSQAEIEGFIDRIDMAEIDGEKYINIIDYKSSEKNTDETLEEAGVQIQPLVYASIACENLKATPSGMMYIHMNEPMLKFNNYPSEEEIEAKRRENIAINGVILGEDNVISGMDEREQEGKGYIPHSKTSGLSREQMQTRIAKAGERAKETAFKIVSGDISIKPYITKQYNACRYCDYFGVCGKRRSN